MVWGGKKTTASCRLTLRTKLLFGAKRKKIIIKTKKKEGGGPEREGRKRGEARGLGSEAGALPGGRGLRPRSVPGAALPPLPRPQHRPARRARLRDPAARRRGQPPPPPRPPLRATARRRPPAKAVGAPGELRRAGPRAQRMRRASPVPAQQQGLGRPAPGDGCLSLWLSFINPSGAALPLSPGASCFWLPRSPPCCSASRARAQERTKDTRKPPIRF